MVEKIQFNSPDEAKRAADAIMDLQDTATDDVWKRGEATVLAPTQNNFSYETYKKLQAGESLGLSEIKNGLTCFGKQLLIKASVMYVIMPDGLTMNELKCRYPASRELALFHQGVANQFFTQTLFPNGLK